MGVTMFQLIGKLLRDRRGTVMAGDWVFVATILILGAVTGLATMRQTRPLEMSEAVKTRTVSKAPSAGH
jgi:hypothetical protein